MEIIVHTRSNCPWCDMAKDWLTSNGFKYKVVVHDDIREKMKFYESCGNDVRSVPQIFVDDERIGGYQDLIKSGIEQINVKFDSEF